METDWKTKLLALHANSIAMGNTKNCRLIAMKKFKSRVSTKENPVDMSHKDYVFKEQHSPDVYTKFLQSDIARDMQEYNVPSAHVIWILDTIKKLTIEERRQFLKTLPKLNIKFTARRIPKYMFPPAVITSSLISDTSWKQNYNALRDFVYPKNRNTTTQAQ